MVSILGVCGERRPPVVKRQSSRRGRMTPSPLLVRRQKMSSLNKAGVYDGKFPHNKLQSFLIFGHQRTLFYKLNASIQGGLHPLSSRQTASLRYLLISSSSLTFRFSLICSKLCGLFIILFLLHQKIWRFLCVFFTSDTFKRNQLSLASVSSSALPTE